MQVCLGVLKCLGTMFSWDCISPPGRLYGEVLGNISKKFGWFLSSPRGKGKNILVRTVRLVKCSICLSTHVCAFFLSKVAKSYMEALLTYTSPTQVMFNVWSSSSCRVWTRLYRMLTTGGRKQPFRCASSSIIIVWVWRASISKRGFRFR